MGRGGDERYGPPPLLFKTNFVILQNLKIKCLGRRRGEGGIAKIPKFMSVSSVIFISKLL